MGWQLDLARQSRLCWFDITKWRRNGPSEDCSILEQFYLRRAASAESVNPTTRLSRHYGRLHHTTNERRNG